MIPPRWPPEDPAIEQNLREAWSSGSWGKYHGAFAPQLENELSEFHGVPFCRLCSSGTVAVEIALRAVGVQAGSEVILGGYDFKGNFRCIEHLGGRPVLVDNDASTTNTEPSVLDKAAGDKTAAVIVSHLHGGLAPMQQIMAWSEATGIPVVEDACQAHGAIVDGQLAGTWGNASTLSFGGSKLMTAGRGGAILTREAEIAQRMKIYAEQGNDAYPLSELQAAVLLPQLARLNELNGIRRKAAARLRTAIADSDALSWVGTEPDEEMQPSYYKVSCLVARSRTRDELLSRAADLELDLKPGFSGFVKRSDRRCRKVGQLVGSKSLADRLVVMHHPYLLMDDRSLEAICRKLARTIVSYSGDGSSTWIRTPSFEACHRSPEFKSKAVSNPPP